MIYAIDTEFLEDGSKIELVSIGIVAEDGRKYYAVNGDIQWWRVQRDKWDWVRNNVWPHLPKAPGSQCPDLEIDKTHKDVKPKSMIANEVKNFLLRGSHYGIGDAIPDIELWADYPSYDFVALCQLWGRMVDLPTGIPQRINDISQYAGFMGVKEHMLPKQDEATKHHALYDAGHALACLAFLNSINYLERYVTGVSK